MTKLFGCTFSALVAFAVFQTIPASAQSVATRCDSYGCAKIVCYRGGDHCYRADRERYQPEWSGRHRDGDDYDREARWDSGYRDRDRDGDRSRDGWRYRCNYEADHCDVRRDRYGDSGW